MVSIEVHSLHKRGALNAGTSLYLSRVASDKNSKSRRISSKHSVEQVGVGSFDSEVASKYELGRVRWKGLGMKAWVADYYLK